MFQNFQRKIVLKQKTKLNPVEVGNKKYKRSPMEKCPGFGLVFSGEANYSREVNISPGIPDRTIPRGGGGSLSGNPDVRRPFPRPEIPRGMSGRGRGISGAPLHLWLPSFKIILLRYDT